MKKKSKTPGVYRRGKTYTVHLHWTDREGKAQQHKKGGFRTQAEAVRYQRDYLTQVHSGRRVGSSKLRLADYLEKEWLPSKEHDIKPSTFASYRDIINGHIIPHLGTIRLEELTTRRVEAFYGDLKAGKGSARALSPKTIGNVAGVLKTALRDAIRWGLLAVNPIAEARRPSGRTREMNAWEPEDLAAFLDASRSDRQGAIWHLAATTGQRRGELLGLRWSDIDLDNATITIRTTRVRAGGVIVEETPKTAKSRRTISIDKHTVDALRRLKAQQAEDKLAHGEIWQNDGNFIAIEEDGQPTHPHTFSVRFRRLIRHAGLPNIRLHDLRHSYVVAARRAKIDTKTISERIGHADTSVTLRVYDHVFRDDDTEAANRIAESLYTQPRRATRK
jgi:integrase